MPELILYADGLCEPFNPGGVACYGWVAFEDGNEIASGYGCIGRGQGMSNNVAEYRAALEAMRWAVAQKHKGVILRMDSQLVVCQASGKWACRAEHLRSPLEELRCLLRQAEAKIEWVPRERNGRADALSRKAYEESSERARMARAAYAGEWDEAAPCAEIDEHSRADLARLMQWFAAEVREAEGSRC